MTFSPEKKQPGEIPNQTVPFEKPEVGGDRGVSAQLDVAEAILNSVRDPLLILNRDLCIEKTNKAFDTTFKQPLGGCLEKEIDEIGSGILNTPELARALENMLTDHQPFDNCEITCDLPEAGVRIFVVNGRKLNEPGEPFTKILLGLQDITERRQTERSLAEKARLLDLINDAIIVRDAQSRICLWNGGAEKHYGYSSAEVMGMDLHSLLKTEFPKPMEEILTQVHRTGEFQGEVVQVARDGRRLTMLCRWVFDSEKQKILTSYTDICDRKHAEGLVKQALDKTIASANAKDEFLATLSHELRTPLSPVLLMASEAADDLSISAHAREIFGMIMRNVKLEVRLIDDLLDMTRINNGKMLIGREVVDVHLVLRDAIETVRSDLSEKQLTLKCQLSALNAQVMGDPVRLQQVFWNVLRNAAKFTPVGGEITVGSRLLPDRILEIRISDSGIGMTPEELERVFNRFSQGEHANAFGPHLYGGLGLGLAISRTLLELHSGTIGAESEGPGKGATFSIMLPQAKEAAHPADVQAEQAPHDKRRVPISKTPPRLKRVLLVEDHESTRKALAQLLVRRHYEVVAVGSVSEARLAMEGTSFDLLISDIGLPDGTGHALMMELNQRSGLRGIALTGYGYEEDLARSREAGFITHLTKPVSVETLERALSVAQAETQS